MTDMDALHQSASAGNLADLKWYYQLHLNELIKKHDKTGNLEPTYTISQPDNYKHFTILNGRDRYVGGGWVSVTEDLQTVKANVVEVVDAKRGYNRTLFGLRHRRLGVWSVSCFRCILVRLRHWGRGRWVLRRIRLLLGRLLSILQMPGRRSTEVGMGWQLGARRFCPVRRMP